MWDFETLLCLPKPHSHSPPCPPLFFNWCSQFLQFRYSFLCKWHQWHWAGFLLRVFSRWSSRPSSGHRLRTVKADLVPWGNTRTLGSCISPQSHQLATYINPDIILYFERVNFFNHLSFLTVLWHNRSYFSSPFNSPHHKKWPILGLMSQIQ